MEFIGRERELKILEKEYSKESSFVSITGRRRVGKTRLIKEFLKEKNSMYFLPTKQIDRFVLDDFSESVCRYSGRIQGKYRNWKEALLSFAESNDDKKVLVIDEFQNLFEKDKSFLSVFQEIWDEHLSSKNIMLIVCGSHVTTMESLDKDHDSPLYGRLSRHITLFPLSFKDVRDDENYIESLENYAVLGGIPRYMELFDEKTLLKNIEYNVLDPSALMFDDPEILLGYEVREPTSYTSIMKAIANGNRKITSISSALEIPATTLNTYLKRLIEVNMLERTVPITDSNPEKSKNGLYSISDNYFAFWFKFVYPYRSELTLGNTKWALSEIEKRFVENHVSFVFESVCRDAIRDFDIDVGFIPTRIGSYWNKNTEIDVMAINDTEKKVFAAECKYRRNTPVDFHVLEKLENKCRSLDELKDYEITYGLFSVSGFDQSILSRKDVILINEGKVVNRE